MTLLAERPTRQVMTQQAHPDFRLHSDMRLAALPSALTCAQLFTKYTLQAWRLDELLEPAHQCVTELVTRAVRTTGVTALHPRWTELDNLKLIVVRLLVIEQRLIIEVAYSDPAFDTTIPGGTLTVVPALCRRWNFYQPKSGGKVIWAELLISPQTSALVHTQELPLPPLPKRTPKREPVDPIEVMNEPGILRRVRDGLAALDDEDSSGGDLMR
jgi:hypothetical protein